MRGFFNRDFRDIKAIIIGVIIRMKAVWRAHVNVKTAKGNPSLNFHLLISSSAISGIRIIRPKNADAITECPFVKFCIR